MPTTLVGCCSLSPSLPVRRKAGVLQFAGFLVYHVPDFQLICHRISCLTFCLLLLVPSTHGSVLPESSILFLSRLTITSFLFISNFLRIGQVLETSTVSCQWREKGLDVQFQDGLVTQERGCSQVG